MKTHPFKLYKSHNAKSNMEDNKGIREEKNHVLRKEGDKYFIYFGENYPKEPYDFESLGERLKWFLSCEQKGNKVEAPEGEINSFIEYFTKADITPKDKRQVPYFKILEEGIPIPLCYEVRGDIKDVTSWNEADDKYKVQKFAYFKSPDRSEDRSSLKEENEKLNLELLKMDQKYSELFKLLPFEITEGCVVPSLTERILNLKNENERLRGDLALANKQKGEYRSIGSRATMKQDRLRVQLTDLQESLKASQEENNALKTELTGCRFRALGLGEQLEFSQSEVSRLSNELEGCRAEKSAKSSCNCIDGCDHNCNVNGL